MKLKDNSRRLFVSIPVPEKIKEEIHRLRDANRSVEKLIWTRENNLHITAYFIGNIKSEDFPAVSEIVRGIAAVEESFDLEFEKVWLAPVPAKPRMVWLRFSRNVIFTDLANRIHLALRKFIPDNPYHFRDPVPHITLMRFNSTFDASRLNLDVPLKILPIKVRYCELMESVPSPEGVRYISIEKFPMSQHS